MRQNCPNTESLFELITIANEISFWKRASLKWHIRSCEGCQSRCKAISETWSSFFTPEPEVTSSLLKVYSRLQNDETLILKGWKLNESRSRSRGGFGEFLANGWLFRGGIVAAVVGVVSLILWTRFNTGEDGKELLNAGNTIPFAQMRIEDKNSIKVHYVQPELLNTMEFETTGQR